MPTKIQNLTTQTGVTLIEIMVSMVISLIILSGIVTVVMSTHNSFKTETEGSFIQENARYAFDMMARDVRLAGNLGCADILYTKISNVVENTYDGMHSTQFIEGYEASPNASDYPDAMSDAINSDAIIVRFADPETIVTTKSYDSSTKSFSFLSGKTHKFSEGDQLVVVDSTCRNAGYFENTSNTDSILAHTSGGSGNCGNTLYSDSMKNLNCDKTYPTGSVKSYSNGSEVMEYKVHAYYIAESSVLDGVPALKRRRLSKSGHFTEELAQGVESMEIQYGIDSDDDGNVDHFDNADTVADWTKVIAARLELVFRSQTEVFAEAQSVTIGAKTFPNDRYLRQLAAATIKIRNR
ncbi:hypothetical protein TDB9533_04078 [Thalassocella blandensis]|nr:hypothetical protein TDB9533_04078 [Thalassocella blandensis]